MVMFPDYPDRIVAEHRIRVERSALLGTFILIITGGWWLFTNMESDKDLVFRFGPVLIMFICAYLLPELIDFGPNSRAKVASLSNILWPSILAFTGANYTNDSNYFSLGILLILILSLWLISNSILGSNLATRRLRGITSIGGLAIALAILSSIDNIIPWLLVITSISITMIPDLFKKDSEHILRKNFAKELDIAELKLLELRSEGHNMQQSSSILKVAREEGFDNPEQGLKSIEDALMDAKRIMALSKDIEEIRANSLSELEKMESITTIPKGPRDLFNKGEKEFDFGSLLEAELLYRKSKDNAIEIAKHWQEASNLILQSEEMISHYDGHQVKGVISMLNSAKDALSREDPKEAKQITESIQYHIKSIGSNEENATLIIGKVEEALLSIDSEIKINSKERLKEAKYALKSGNSTLAKGLADSILREISTASESMQKVQKALRQKIKIEARFPSGNLRNEWVIKLDKIVKKSSSGSWIEASDDLDDLIKSLNNFELEGKESKELLVFIQDDWEILRKALDSFGIGPSDEMRLNIEQSVAKASKCFEEGDIQSCLSNLAKSDELIENIRRRI